ncbi:MAG: hypothetical protein KA138_12670 [Saprospiraceae bacterium]|nr:hypothetical protein [Saprospiraceae bacterium]
MKKHLLFGLVFVTFSLAAQSPWPRSKAGFFVQAAWQTIPTYDAIFESKNDQNVPPDREVSENAFQLYGEYGLDSRTTMVASLPIRFLKNGDFIPDNYANPETLEGSLIGLGNASLGIRRAILGGKVRLTGTLRLDFPSTIYDDNTGLRAGYDAWTVQPSISTGMGFGKVYWFAYGGYGIRTGGFSHNVNAGGEVGIKAWKCWLVGFSELVYSLENGEVALPLHNRIKNLYVDKQGWWSIGGKGIFEANRFWGLTASFAGAGWAQFVPKSPGISLGAYFKWD